MLGSYPQNGAARTVYQGDTENGQKWVRVTCFADLNGDGRADLVGCSYDGKVYAFDADGKELQGAATGNLCLINSWPGQMRTVYGDHQRFFETYFSTYPGKYFTGDGCRRDADGYYWITGRVDDVINVSGHRLGTAEIESALVAHETVAEAAVVGYPHDIKGQGVYAYVTLNAGVEPTEDLRKALVLWVRHEIGPFAAPDVIQWAPGLPKTRSGKIMRRLLRSLAKGEAITQDTSTLENPAILDQLGQAY